MRLYPVSYHRKPGRRVFSGAVKKDAPMWGERIPREVRIGRDDDRAGDRGGARCAAQVQGYDVLPALIGDDVRVPGLEEAELSTQSPAGHYKLAHPPQQRSGIGVLGGNVAALGVDERQPRDAGREPAFAVASHCIGWRWRSRRARS